MCYNHAAFVEEALFSVVNQTYHHIQLIVVDDASTDDSLTLIKDFIQEFPQTQLITNTDNLGNCRSFNKALTLAKGKYLIDLAADDALLDTRIEKQVTVFESLDDNYGVIFTNALYLDERSQIIGTHYKTNLQGKSKMPVPSGDVYTAILRSYFICTPTMMMRKSVLDKLGGYDENLSYEDFDFWVRSSRKNLYYYLDDILTLKRKVKGSLSTQFYSVRKNEMLASTLMICRKAQQLNQTEAENKALATCVRYHLRQSYFTQNFPLVFEYAQLLKEIDKLDKLTQAILVLSKQKAAITPLYRLYLRLLLKLK